MRKMIEVEAEFCDSCQKRAMVNTCMRCGIEHCYDCKEKLGVSYDKAVYFRGTGDGYYCRPCNTTLLIEGPPDKLFNAYLAIQRLQFEYKGFIEDFDARKKAAEREVERLYDEYRAARK